MHSLTKIEKNKIQNIKDYVLHELFTYFESILFIDIKTFDKKLGINLFI